jgi:hypothetical protein
MPHLFEKENTDITPEQMDYFASQIKDKRLKRIKLLGGEPLMSKYFGYTFEILKKCLKEGIIGGLKVDYNHTIPWPKELEIIPGIRLMGKSQAKKMHLPMLDPEEWGFKLGAQPKCQALSRCGYSYDWKGFLPCSPAIALVREHKLEHLYRKEAPIEPWGLDELCKHCVMAMPPEWIETHYEAVI